MKTIKEEDEDKNSNNGSDTAYFSPDATNFNDRDDDDDDDYDNGGYDSEEVKKEYEKRY